MIISVTLAGPTLQHMQPKQFGAFVQHCAGLKDFYSITCYAGKIEISFSLGSASQLVDSAKIQSQLAETAEAIAKLDPYPCPCGCGAYIAISPCFRQSEDEDEHGLTPEEMRLGTAGQKIDAIRSIRDRTKMSVSDARDLFYKAFPSTLDKRS